MHVAIEEIEASRKNAFDKAFESDDTLFHFMLYDWLISQSLVDAFLEVLFNESTVAMQPQKDSP